jgi:adenylosuccinate lyase
MIPRYSTPAMAHIWSDANAYELWRRIEVAVCEAWADDGVIPRDAIPPIAAAGFDIERVREIEREVRHDLIAFVRALAEDAGDAGRYIHYGLTSNDVKDTATAIQLTESIDLLTADLGMLEATVTSLAFQHRDTPCIGRSHGIHAEPTTFGHKLIVWVAMLRRDAGRLAAARSEIAVGKISGAVGTHANVPAHIEDAVCARLGLAVAATSTQILQRDRHAAVMATLAVVAATLELIATEIRLLQRTEIAEIAEPFSSGQQGSSAMPHKRNPELSERVCGLARVVRGYVTPALENVALWHERDITHSSAERVIFADACLALDYMIQTLNRVLVGLEVYPARMRANIDHTRGLVFSERVLLALVQSGMARNDAYQLVQGHAKTVWAQTVHLRDLLAADERVTSRLGPDELDECFALDYHLKNVDVAFERLGLGRAVTPVTAAAR